MCGKACTTVYIDVRPKTDDTVTGSQMKWVMKIFLNTSKLQVGLMRQTGIIHVNLKLKSLKSLLQLKLKSMKSLLHQGLSEPEFYGDLVYKFKKIRGMTDFSDQFRKIIIRYKRIGYNLNVMRQSACLVINPITVDSYVALFNCTPVDRASDSMMAPT